MSDQKVRIGFVGCGDISDAYLKISRKFEILQTVAVADIDRARAKAKAKQFDVPVVCGTRTLMKRDDIDIVVNLTPPLAHAKINLAALRAGKHVYSEKPLAAKRTEGKKILEAARAGGLRVGCAPDTVLGGGLQTSRKLLDDGAIGEPIAAAAFMISHGAEHWHPNPEFHYKPGGGPMFDMGPYYLSTLTMLLGPIKRVAAMTKILINPRLISSEPKRGQLIEVETPDHVVGLMEFDNGAVGTIMTTFAVWGSQVPRIEIYGTEGTLGVPDPNRFSGPVKLLKGRSKEWVDVPLTHGYAPENQRSLGLADMAMAIRTGRAHRCTGRQAHHVLDVMHCFLEAGKYGKSRGVTSTFDRPAPLPPDLADGQLDP